MPFSVTPDLHCVQCSHGYCVSNIREQSKRMKDRDTQYRLSQITGMACAFDSWIPGEQGCPIDTNPPLTWYLERLVSNARAAGRYIEQNSPGVFGSPEKSFFLTEAQIGKVRGDVYEAICRAILWNCSVRLNVRSKGRRVAMFSLGDNYNLLDLFTPPSGQKLKTFTETLATREITLSYSTPDLVAVDISELDKATQDYFAEPILTLSTANQEHMNRARLQVAGKLTPKNVILACGLKTSIRSDRMFQFLFEANAWKYLWRRAFELPPCPYHSVIGQTFGADSERLRSIDFSSVDGPNGATRAIDGMTEISTPNDVRNWYSTVVEPLVT
jgi:hypothetical protein